MKNGRISQRLKQIFLTADEIILDPDDRIAVFSDLHLGDGGSRDDFAHNGRLVGHIFESHYESEGFTVILNGDIEELQRFYPQSIHERWQNIYRILGRLQDGGRLIKLFGNHDIELKFRKHKPGNLEVREACRLRVGNSTIFILHGHQASWFFTHLNTLASLLLRLVANPLGIKNYAVAFNSKKKFRVEKRIYEFAKSEGILALIGHTHRPLFESLSKEDRVKFQIEKLCREYTTVEDAQKEILQRKIVSLKQELSRLRHRRRYSYESSLYHRGPLVPSLFNSGSAIGKRGVTALEIDRGVVRLVYWYDRRIPQKVFEYDDFPVETLDGSYYSRLILNQESLDYLFTRILLLS